MKREDDIGPPSPLQDFMRASDSFDLPTDAEESRKNTRGRVDGQRLMPQ
jgi:hypothetical protein